MLAVSGHQSLAENSALLQRALWLRNPYVDVLNLAQAEALRQQRLADTGESMCIVYLLMMRRPVERVVMQSREFQELRKNQAIAAQV